MIVGHTDTQTLTEGNEENEGQPIDHSFSGLAPIKKENKGAALARFRKIPDAPERQNTQLGLNLRQVSS